MCKEKMMVDLNEVTEVEVDYKQLIATVLEGTYTQDGEEYSSDYSSHFGTYEGRDFLIVCSNKEEEQIEKELGKSLDDMLDNDYGFDDEYSKCSGCGKILRTSPDSYQWKPDWAIVNDCEMLCFDCIDPEDYLKEIENNPKTANQVLTEEQILEAGYAKIGNYEDGWYDAHDNPETIYEAYKDKYESIVFTITQHEQFTMFFSAYGKNNIEE